MFQTQEKRYIKTTLGDLKNHRIAGKQATITEYLKNIAEKANKKTLRQKANKKQLHKGDPKKHIHKGEQHQQFPQRRPHTIISTKANPKTITKKGNNPARYIYTVLDISLRKSRE